MENWEFDPMDSEDCIGVIDEFGKIPRPRLEPQIDFRVALVNSLGSKCVKCGQSRLEFLQLDHVKNDAVEDKKIHKNDFNLYRYWYSQLYRGFGIKQKFQVLCVGCNQMKRIVNQSRKKYGKPPIEKIDKNTEF